MMDYSWNKDGGPMVFKNWTEWAKFNCGGDLPEHLEEMDDPEVVEELCEDHWLSCNGGRN
ncbi:MAG: hypothetical protein WA117_01950 [Verrucomicrobiia bacterium]